MTPGRSRTTFVNLFNIRVTIEYIIDHQQYIPHTSFLETLPELQLTVSSSFNAVKSKFMFLNLFLNLSLLLTFFSSSLTFLILSDRVELDLHMPKFFDIFTYSSIFSGFFGLVFFIGLEAVSRLLMI